MGLSDIGKAMSPVRASYQARVQSQNAVTEEVVQKNESRQNQTPQLMGSSFEISNRRRRFEAQQMAAFHGASYLDDTRNAEAERNPRHLH